MITLLLSGALALSPIVATASQYEGVKYVSGGESPRGGFDCSGYTQYIYKRTLGVKLPRTADAQYKALRHGTLANAAPGDLIFFGGSYKHHVGVYAGHGMMWHAPKTGDHVRLAKIYSRTVTVGHLPRGRQK